jgi:hypothetical protein
MTSGRRTNAFTPCPAALYCVVYALDAAGKKLTPKDSNASTPTYYCHDVTAATYPVWNSQFDLFCPDIVSKFESIRIKIKLPKTGVLRDRNFGMVTIRPKDLFRDYPSRSKTVLLREFDLPIERCANGISGTLDDKKLGFYLATIPNYYIMMISIVYRASFLLITQDLLSSQFALMV